MYTTNQAYACALATMLGCTSKPEVQGPGYYGHYHDKNHIIHIWYGYPVNYRYKILGQKIEQCINIPDNIYDFVTDVIASL
jgi:hypothetical protein